MLNMRCKVAVLCLLRSILLLVVILTPCLIKPLPSAAAPGTNTFTGSVYVTDWVTFTNTGSMNVARFSHTATLLNNGKVLVVGGRGLGYSYLISAELYDPVAGTWSTTGNMNVDRIGHTASLLNNGKVLVVGGTNGTSIAIAELYDPATGLWSITGNMNSARAYHTATLLNDGRVLVTGGYGGGSSALASTELYDPATGTWSNTGNMNGARMDHTATLLNNGQVLVAGGWRVGGSPCLFSAELYDPTTGTWSYTGSMNVDRLQHTATLLGNGKVLVAGDGDSADLYDPATGSWSTTGSMNIVRLSNTATLLSNGQVLAAGGYELASAELYNPVTGIWTTVGSMDAVREHPTATLLNNGIVLVAGGYGGGSYLTSAELATFMPGNTFTGTLTLPSGWLSSTTISAQFVGTSSAAAINSGALSNDNNTWGSWITATSDITITTTWTVSGESSSKPVYLCLRDVNGQVATVVTGTVNIDLTKPTSTMTALPAISPANISLSWSGTDALSGISTYDVQVRAGTDGVWTDVLSNSTYTNTNYTGASGITYYFRARASDVAGNVEEWSLDYDTFTLVLWKVFLPLVIK